MRKDNKGRYEVVHISLRSYYNRIKHARRLLDDIIQSDELIAMVSVHKLAIIFNILTEMQEAVVTNAHSSTSDRFAYLEDQEEVDLGEECWYHSEPR